jgi:hypothetical protein
MRLAVGNPRVSSLTWPLILGLGLSLPAIMLVILIVAVVTSGPIVLGLGLHLISLTLTKAMAHTWGEGADGERRKTASEWTVPASAIEAPELSEVVSAAPPGPVTVVVVKATGVCPLGFRPDHIWLIDGDGRLSRPLCKPVVSALDLVFQSWPQEEEKQLLTCCCPIDNRQREVVFMVQAGARVRAVA